MNKISLKFRSQQLENEYLALQLDLLSTKHRHISCFIILVLCSLCLTLLLLQNYIASAMIFLLNTFMVIQLIYYNKNKSLNCSLVIALINIIITAERWNFAFNPQMYPNTDENGHYLMGLSFMMIHQNLLFDPRFLFNSIVYIIITGSYCLADYFFRREFNYAIFPFISCIVFQLYGNYLQQRVKREQYLYKRRNQKQETIGCKIVKEPCALFYYDYEKVSFLVKDSNQGFKDLFKHQLQKQSLNSILSQVKIDSEDKNVQSYCYKQVKINQQKETWAKFNCCLQENNNWKCEIHFDVVEQPTFMIKFDQSQELSKIIEVQKTVIHSLKLICRAIFRQNLSQQRQVGQKLKKINSPHVYQLRKQQILQKLQYENQISLVCQSNTFQMIEKNGQKQLKIEQFNFLTKIQMKIIPMFQGKIILIDNFQVQNQEIWSSEKLFFQFIITLFQLASFRINARTYIHMEDMDDKIKLVGKFPQSFNSRFNFKLMTLKCNLKLLGPTSEITLGREDGFTIYVYKDLRRIYE